METLNSRELTDAKAIEAEIPKELKHYIATEET